MNCGILNYLLTRQDSALVGVKLPTCTKLDMRGKPSHSPERLRQLKLKKPQTHTKSKGRSVEAAFLVWDRSQARVCTGFVHTPSCVQKLTAYIINVTLLPHTTKSCQLREKRWRKHSLCTPYINDLYIFFPTGAH